MTLTSVRLALNRTLQEELPEEEPDEEGSDDHQQRGKRSGLRLASESRAGVTRDVLAALEPPQSQTLVLMHTQTLVTATM